MAEQGTWGKEGPRCPNHRVQLVDCHKGVGICPISDCRFEYDEDEAMKNMKHRINAMGQMEKVIDWKVKPADGEEEEDD